MKHIALALCLMAALGTTAVAANAGVGAPSPGDALRTFDLFLRGPAQRDRADVNCDGEFTPGDALAIYERYLLDEPREPCGEFSHDGPGDTGTPPALFLHHRVETDPGGDPVRYEVTFEVETSNAFNAFGLRLHYPAGQLKFIAIEPGYDTQFWVAIDGAERVPGEIIIGGFDTGPTASTGSLEIFHLVFEPRSTAVDGRAIICERLHDDLHGARIESDAARTDAERPTPAAFHLSANVPNPFNPQTAIRFDIPAGRDGNVRTRLAVFDVSGRLVRVLVNDTRPPGFHEVYWDGNTRSGIPAASGVYFYRMQAGSFVESRRMVLLK